MNEWLKSFAFKAEISPWLYVLTIALALALSIITTAYQTIKAARANPVDSLRYE